MSAIQRRGILLDGIGAELVRASTGGVRKTLSKWLSDLSAAINLGDVASTFTSGDATPSVLNNSKFIAAGSTAITNFVDGVEGQTITIYRGASDIAITDNATIDPIIAGNITLSTARPSATFRLASGVWKQVEEAGAQSSAMTPVVQAATTDAGVGALNAVLEVATKAALQALTAGVVGAVFVHGRTAVNDGYGGTFVWVSTNEAASVTIDTQGALFVAPDSAPTGASGVWKRIYDGELNLKWFGAKGDNSTNDTTAALAWINACRNFTICGFMPEGDYKVDNLTFGALTEANTISLRGTEENTSRFIKITNDANPVITFNSSGATSFLTNISIRNIGFVGLSSGPCVRHYAMVRSEFVGCEMTGGSIGVEQFGGIGVEYANCGIHDNGINLKIRKYTASIGTGYPNLTTVTGGYITNATTTNVDFDDGKRLELHGVDVEGAVTNILVGANIGSEDSVESYGVVVFGGWIEAATGTAAVSCASGLNCFYAAEVAANSATYDFSFSGGRYVLRDLTGPTSKTTSVLEGGSIGSPNYIENVKLGGALSVDQSKTLVTGSSTQTAAIDLIDKAGTDVASATTTNIGAALGGYINITGTTTITGFGTVAAGVRRTVKFTGALTLTHNGTSLILPGSASITTAANDTAQFASLGSGNWVCLWYKRASGKPIAVAFTDLTGSASVAQMGSTSYGVSQFGFVAAAVNFNSANTDTAIAISLPTGFSRYLVNAVRISGASASITTATFGLFTATGGGGTTIISGGTAITVSSASDASSNNSMSAAVSNANTQSYTLASFPTLYFRVVNAQGSAATANVEIIIVPLT